MVKIQKYKLATAAVHKYFMKRWTWEHSSCNPLILLWKFKPMDIFPPKARDEVWYARNSFEAATK